MLRNVLQAFHLNRNNGTCVILCLDLIRGVGERKVEIFAWRVLVCEVGRVPQIQILSLCFVLYPQQYAEKVNVGICRYSGVQMSENTLKNCFN